MTTFERIKELADKQGKSLQRISEDLGFGVNYLYQLKNQQPTADKLIKLANYFNVSIDYLLGRSDFQNTNAIKGALYNKVKAETPMTFTEVSNTLGLNDAEQFLLKKDLNLEYISKIFKDSNVYFDNDNPNAHFVTWIEGLIRVFKHLDSDIEGLEHFNAVIAPLVQLALIQNSQKSFEEILGESSIAYMKFYDYISNK